MEGNARREFSPGFFDLGQHWPRLLHLWEAATAMGTDDGRCCDDCGFLLLLRDGHVAGLRGCDRNRVLEAKAGILTQMRFRIIFREPKVVVATRGGCCMMWECQLCAQRRLFSVRGKTRERKRLDFDERFEAFLFSGELRVTDGTDLNFKFYG